MDLQLTNQQFIVCGATSGLGLAITRSLMAEGASVLAVARDEEKLIALFKDHPHQLTILPLDLTAKGAITALEKADGNRPIHGIVINAGGPPAKTVAETTLDDWDKAYQTLLRWKIDLAKTYAPKMARAGYGRLLFIESASVKQPLENLVLSNSLRLAVVGFAKTYAQEMASNGVTMNILAPGSHDTPAIERVYKKKSEQTGQSPEAIRAQGAKNIPVGFLGSPSDFASLATWLLSPHARYITGQTISVDGGMVKYTFG